MSAEVAKQAVPGVTCYGVQLSLVSLLLFSLQNFFCFVISLQLVYRVALLIDSCHRTAIYNSFVVRAASPQSGLPWTDREKKNWQSAGLALNALQQWQCNSFLLRRNTAF